MSATWSGFQSLIQLSIALNAAFAAFGTYASSSITVEQAKLHDMYRDIQEGRTFLPPKSSEDVGGAGEVTLVAGRCQTILQDYNDFVQGPFRLFCIVFSAAGIPLLVYASYAADCPIAFHLELVVMALFGPFYWGIWRVIWFSVRVYKEVSVKRAYIGSRLTKVA